MLAFISWTFGRVCSFLVFFLSFPYDVEEFALGILSFHCSKFLLPREVQCMLNGLIIFLFLELERTTKRVLLVLLSLFCVSAQPMH